MITTKQKQILIDKVKSLKEDDINTIPSYATTEGKPCFNGFITKILTGLENFLEIDNYAFFKLEDDIGLDTKININTIHNDFRFGEVGFESAKDQVIKEIERIE